MYSQHRVRCRYYYYVQTDRYYYYVDNCFLVHTLKNLLEEFHVETGFSKHVLNTNASAIITISVCRNIFNKNLSKDTTNTLTMCAVYSFYKSCT